MAPPPTEAEARERLVALGAQYGFHVLADEVYQLLTFPHVEAPPRKSDRQIGRL